ncbi:hypothetical protein NE236_05760 [Actinoallomurus purpureus]|uniref:effector-associated constant component EACC1 n=1 Tax=Actinoallomurus purpureus TaxID=478114 RepID=UPI002093BB14|nr:hypothetical protein [Actinoallomurus purpureus]MCO6004482.1 hypothetical protein [Actinoallomurus purpureus]
MSAENREEDLRSFYEWLGEEPDVRRHATISLEPGKPTEGEMGSALEIVKLVIDTNFQILNFGLAYVAWRTTRKKPAALTVERDGTKITLDDADPETVARILQALEE